MFRAQCVLVVALLVGLAHSWDIVISTGDRLEFYTEDGTKIDTKRFTSQNLTTLAYDEVHNMLLYVDKQNSNDAICGYNLTSMYYKCYVERNGRNIHNLAFDPITETLFFTDTKERSINWYSFKPGFKNNRTGNLYMKMDDGVPTDIVVDSCKGYIYWINTRLPTSKSTIERARFNGSGREVVISSEYDMDLHSLAIDLQTKRIFFYMPMSSYVTYVYRAGLNGKHKEPLLSLTSTPGQANALDSLNSIFISKKFLILFDWCLTCGQVRRPWLFPKLHDNYRGVSYISTKHVVGLAANYKLKEKIPRNSDCNHGPDSHLTNDLLEIDTKYEGLFCLHGTKVDGQSLCKCTPGYTGERCEVSVCENYCLQGNCSLSEYGLPQCRCEAGYSGKRCEVDACNGYCSNGGTCSLDDDSQPICQCQGDYVGHRCEKSGCVNYCLKGNCSFSEQGHPECRCEAGYSGERCEVNACNGFCLNSGICSLNEEDQPICECLGIGEYEGYRCELPVGLNDCDTPACHCAGSQEGRETKSSSYYLADTERNLTITDLLENWRKHAQ